MAAYTNEELTAIYELGRVYFEMGYFAPAERIFSGLSVVDEGRSLSRLGLGLIKLERGLYQEAVTHFRAALESGSSEIQAKLGLCASFIAMDQVPRAQSILREISQAMQSGQPVEGEVKRLFEAFAIRCRG